MIQPIYFFRSRWDELLITGIYLNSLVAAFFSQDMGKFFITAIISTLLLALVFGLRLLYNRRSTPLRGENTAFQVPRKGLVFTVGGQTDTIHMAMSQQKPKCLALICSPQTEAVANQIVEEFGYDLAHYKKEIVDPKNIKEIRTKADLILNWMAEKGLKPEEIAVDITGGMKTLSIGVFSLTEERQVDSQYIHSQYKDNKPVDGTQEAILVSQYSKE